MKLCPNIDKESQMWPTMIVLCMSVYMKIKGSFFKQIWDYTYNHKFKKKFNILQTHFISE